MDQRPSCAALTRYSGPWPCRIVLRPAWYAACSLASSDIRRAMRYVSANGRQLACQRSAPVRDSRSHTPTGQPVAADRGFCTPARTPDGVLQRGTRRTPRDDLYVGIWRLCEGDTNS